jgi:hypothetical protein
VCSDSPEYIDCDECNGEGHFYYNVYGEEITREMYNQLPPSDRFSEKCDTCDGIGEVPEPEYHEFEA